MKKKQMVILVVLSIIVILILSFIFYPKDKMETFDMNTKNAKEINAYLINLEKNLKIKEIDFESEKSKNEKVYSLLIKIKDDKSNTYSAYNIDLETKKTLNNEEVAKMYGYSLQDIYDAINKRLEKYYKEEIESGYVDPNECDYKCYLSFYRNIISVDDIYALYVKNNKLNIYISFSIDSLSSDEGYFKQLKYDPFKIEL